MPTSGAYATAKKRDTDMDVEMMRHDHHHRDDESTALLPESRGGGRRGGGGGGRHSYQATAGDRERRGPVSQGRSLPPLAGLVAVGLVVAVTVAAAVIAFSAPQRDYSQQQQQAATSLIISKNTAAADVLLQEGGAISIPPSLLGSNDVVNKDGKSSSSISRGGGGGDGDDGGAVIKQKKKSEEAAAAEEEGGRPPNVIFILIDDVGMNDMGPTSTDMSVATPFIDSLAEGGVRLSRYYTNHICTPARSSIMTGRDTFRTGMQFQELDNAMPWGLPLDEVTLAQRFKAAGYATHMVGKWNLGMFAEDYYPFNRGFDTFLGYMGAEETYYNHTRAESYVSAGGATLTFNDFGYGDKDGYVDTTTNTTREGPSLKGQYSTSLTGDRAVEIAHEHQAANEANGTDNPLFMYLAFQAAHSPMDVPEESLFTQEQLENLALITSESDVRLEFAKIVYFLDITIEKIINDLDAMGMMNNTLVVVASDNGGCPAVGGSNFPYRGFKHTLFEGGVRTQAMVYSKSDLIIPLEARGTLYDGMMHAMDWTPTLANITGIPTTEMGKDLSGFDHWSAILGERDQSLPPVRNEVVLGRNSWIYDSDSATMVETTQPRGAYIYDGWKINIGDKCTGWYSFNPIDNLVFDPSCHVAECPTCTNDCHYVNVQNNTFLFHIETDPYEIYNLVDTMPDKFHEMVQRWNEATADEVKSNYKPEDSLATDTWGKLNAWVVAWR